jgi:N-acetyltransferase
MNITPLILEGTHVRLEPLTLGHLTGLCEIGLDPGLWRWTPMMLQTPDDMRTYVLTALKGQEEGTVLPFATFERSTGALVGSTRFGNIDHKNMGAEIGWTWLGQRWQRTPINTEAKYLMLRHGFESLGCIRIGLKTDVLNEQSRNAIMRLGAREEGVLRNHMLTHSGRIRNTVYYSIINSEWPAVKTQLEEKLRRPFKFQS